MSKLKGKVAVVTGASKGIGAAIAKSLAAEGASVVVNYASSKSGAKTVVDSITAAGGKAVAVGGDVSKASEAQGIIDAAIKNYGRLDILVNNSGVYEFSPIEAVTEDQFHRMFNINVLGLAAHNQGSPQAHWRGRQHHQCRLGGEPRYPSCIFRLYRHQGRGRRHHRCVGPRVGTEEDSRERHQSRHGRNRRRA